MENISRANRTVVQYIVIAIIAGASIGANIFVIGFGIDSEINGTDVDNFVLFGSLGTGAAIGGAIGGILGLILGKR